jgi:hypothetical protein
MGLHASPTCALVFGEQGDGATGWMVGGAHQGLACMFTMMNRARLSTGLQGIAAAERATQAAYSYARERVQGRPPGATAPRPIIEHPDVRRMLLSMRADTLAARALAYAAAVALDRAQRDPDPTRRTVAADRGALLTPMVKAWCTDIGVDVASTAIQVHGGLGYVEESGITQLLRDVRIAPIYEGTNGIQAQDLVGRKIVRDGGAAALALLDEVAGEVAAAAARPRLAGPAQQALAAIDTVRRLLAWILEDRRADADRLAAAAPILSAFAATVAGTLLLKGAALDDATAPPDLIAVAGIFAANRLVAAAGAEQQVHGLLEPMAASDALLAYWP